MAGEENKKCGREATVYNRFWTKPNTVVDASCCYKELFHTIVCRKKHSQNVFVTNCITGYFSLCSVEIVKNFHKRFLCRLFLTMLLFAKCETFITFISVCFKTLLCKVNLL